MYGFALIGHVLGVLLMAFSCFVSVPLGLSLYFNDGEHQAFWRSFLTIFGLGVAFYLATYSLKRKFVMRTKYAFLGTFLAWVALSLAGSLPFMFMTSPLAWFDAIFESASGLTTTGATILTRIETLPPSVLLYRQLLQWLGGMGIIVLAVAILPYLGVGGMQLYRSETVGPTSSKFTPSIAQTAKSLWGIYFALTVLCALAYWGAGMKPFDALAHSLSTVSIGGFSTYDNSFAQFMGSPWVYGVGMVFMLVAAMNFNLHFLVLRRGVLGAYFKDSEFLFFMLFILVAVVGLNFAFWLTSAYQGQDAWHRGAFQVISVATTTGFTDQTLNMFLPGVAFILFSLAFVGGCAGSTGGGMKAIRVLLLIKQGHRELKKLLHPQGVFRLRLGHAPVSERVAESVWGFVAIYLLVFMTLVAVMLLLGGDMETAWSAVGACLNNLGPGMGDVALHYGNLDIAEKLVLVLTMIMGRLEIFTVLVLFLPQTWR